MTPSHSLDRRIELTNHDKTTPGMPEMLTLTDAIKGAGYAKVALITDGRFAGVTRGPCIGHVEMEAYNCGAIGAIKNGDIIEIDIPQSKLTPLLAPYRNSFKGINCYGK